MDYKSTPRVIALNNIYVMDKEEFVVGRCANAQIDIPSVTVSRTHCILRKVRGSFAIIDKSSSGTFVNGKPLKKNLETPIKDGDNIIVGQTNDFRYVFCEGTRKCTHNCIAGFSSKDCIYRRRTLVPSKEVSSDEDGKSDKARKSDVARKSAEEAERKKEEEKAKKMVVEVEEKLKKEEEKAKKKVVEVEEKLKKEEENSKKKVVEVEETLKRNFGDLLESEMQCSICNEIFVKAMTLGCSHTFCQSCIFEWSKKSSDCPICRKKIKKKTRSLVIDNFVDRMVESLSPDLKKRRLEVVEEREKLSEVVVNTTPIVIV